MTRILCEREGDGALLRVFRGPAASPGGPASWLAIPEEDWSFALGCAEDVWAPGPSEPGTMVRAAAGLEPGSGPCAATMTCNGLGTMEDMRQMVRDVVGDGSKA